MKDKILERIRCNKLLSRILAEYQYIKVYFNRGCAEELNEHISQYVPVGKQNNRKYISRLKKDILFSCNYYRIHISEYFLFDFERLSNLGRGEFVGRYQQHKFWNKFYQEETYSIFADKVKTFNVFKEYYGREVERITSTEDFDKFDKFTKKYSRFVVKPISDYQGNGVHIIDNRKDELNLEEVFEECLSFSGGAIIEEVIVQDSEMAKFHPESVNTIRFITFYHNGVLNKIGAVLRMGRNGNFIDNACAGGIFATIDIETGIVDTPGTTKNKERYLSHPDTGVQILGTQIPYWKELNELIEKVVRVVPEQKQVGWDFALTDKGWIVVEGNEKPMVQAFFHNRGLRKEFQCMFDAYNE